jgi:Flp pilus assembly pilin Flp
MILMNKLKSYSRKFFKNEDGAELIEWAVILALVVGLIVAAVKIVDLMNNKLDETQSQLESGLNQVGPGGSSGSGSGGTPAGG